MSLATTEDPNKKLSTRKTYAWETEETLVGRRKKLRYRIMRIFTFRRVVIAIFLAVFLYNPSFSLWLINDAGPFILRIVLTLTFAIGQFVLIFWFLGRARMYTVWPGSTSEGISFADYRGQPELLSQAKQIVKLVRGVRVFEEAGGEPLNGLLLEGPPGTGKTWLAQAISTEAGVPFFYLDASSMQSMFMGIAPLKVMNLYRKARNAAKDYGAAIIFIDEIDAIGARGGVSTKSEWEESRFSRNRLPMFFGGGGAGSGLLSALLVEMDGFSVEHGFWARKKNWFYRTILRRKPPKPERRVLTIGATNRIGALDPAMLRPGRFDKKVRVDAPDMEGRREIIEYYLSKMSHDETMDPLILASETQNYTPADIKYLLNEALRYALFDGRTYITYEDFRRAQPEHEIGLRSPIKSLSNKDKYRLAAHEAGHAIAIRLFTPAFRISRITIIRQGGALGHVSSQPATESFDYLQTFDYLLNRLKVSVAGRAAEYEFCGEDQRSLSVYGDFPAARYYLNQMAAAGMFGALGISQPEAQDVAKMKEEVMLMALSETRMALRLHREMGDALIDLLMKENELLAREVEAFFDQYGLYTPKISLQPQAAPALANSKE